MTAVTIPADRDITITQHSDGSVTLDGLVPTDMPTPEPEAEGSIITFTNSWDLKTVGIKGEFGSWHLMESDGDSTTSAPWKDILENAKDGTLRTFPAPR